jgi:hypothetical protein
MVDRRDFQTAKFFVEAHKKLSKKIKKRNKSVNKSE